MAANKHDSHHGRVWLCEVCEQSLAAVICKADAAALCCACDLDIHAANKLDSHPKPSPATTVGATPTALLRNKDFSLTLLSSAALLSFCHDRRKEQEDLEEKEGRQEEGR